MTRKGTNMKNNKINWKQKLSSRKFWAAAAGFVTAVLVAYILGESVVDANRDYTGGDGGTDGTDDEG